MGYPGTIAKTNFVLGELSPRAMGRFDQDKPIYKNGARIIENGLIFQDGGMMYRPGSQYIATAGQVAPVRLEPFSYNLLQQYIVEYGNQYLQFYANAAQVLNAGSTVLNIPSPYLQADIFKIQMAQQSDVQYIAHPNYPVYKLIRTSANSFQIQKVQFIGGPFLPTNIGNVTLTASATTGSVTLTATIPAWSAGVQYIPGDYVTNGGNTYLCIQSNLGGSGLSLTEYTPGTAVNDNTVGTINWSLTSPYTPQANGTTKYLKLTNWGFSIPSSATVLGIVVSVNRNGATDSDGDLGYDNSIKLSKGGTIGGTDHSTSATWPVGASSISYGNASDLWGETLLYSDVNATGFGVAISTGKNFGFTQVGNMNIVSVSITVYYSTGSFAQDLASGYWTLSTGFFQPGHVGSLWTVGTGAAGPPVEPPGTVVITGYTSSTVLSGYVQQNPDGTAGAISTTSATTVWAEGAWSQVRGYPTAVTFHENRLCFFGTTYQPKTGWGSAIGAYESFSPGQETDSDAWNYTASEGDAILWAKSMMVNGSTGLRVGTLAGCTVWLDGSSSGITPSSPPIIALGVDYSVLEIEPAPIGAMLYYATGSGYQLRQLVYDFVTAADKSDDMTLLADHIFRDGGGLIQLARQEAPNDRIWAVRNDGQMCVMTRNAEQQVTGWSRFKTGVQSSGYDTYNSVAIIPISNTDDQVWTAVTRTINGTAVQFIELFTPELFNNYWEPVRLDASLTYDLPLTIVSITGTTTLTVTVNNHGLSNGNQVKLEGIVGYNGALNDQIFTIGGVTTNTFTITAPANSSSSYQRGGTARLLVNSVTGPAYLNGQAVYVVTDGKNVSTTTYNNGVSLGAYAVTVHIGLFYPGTLGFLPLGGDGQTVNQGKKRKLGDVVFRVWKSLGGQFGMDTSHLNNLNYTDPENINRNTDDSILFTGDLHFVPLDSQYTFYCAPVFVQNQPLPFMLLAAILMSNIEDK